jgi:oligopeptide/dipeptide ABC transporter ATP-binding protein
MTEERKKQRYTKALLSVIPIPGPFIEETHQPIILKGEVPSPAHPLSGCHSHPRCTLAIPECAVENPPVRNIGGGHEVACYRV